MKPGGANKRTGYRDIWDAVRRWPMGAPFSASDLALTLFCEPNDVRDYLNRLVKAGYLRTTSTQQTLKHYEVARPLPHEAPRLRRDGTHYHPTKREAMWRSMKMLSTWNVPQLTLAASTDAVPVKERDATDYVCRLHKAGYLAVVKEADPRGGRAVYRLVRNTGARPPQVLKTRVVYDPNRGEIVWVDDKGLDL